MHQPAGPRALRLFVAAVPDAAAREALAAVQRDWAAALERATSAGSQAMQEPWERREPRSARPCRLLPPSSLHLTLRFLGTTPAERLAPLCTALAEATAAASSCEARLQRIEHWPPRAPRVVVAAFDAPEALAALARALESAVRQLGFAPEPQRFRAHVTLARCRGQPLPRVPLALPRVIHPVRELVLFESRTLPDGPVYTALSRFPLPV